MQPAHAVAGPSDISAIRMTTPLDPDLFFASASSRLRPGTTVRVKRAGSAGPIQGKVRAAEPRGLLIELPRPFFRTESDWETYGDSDQPRIEQMRWQDIERLWIRTHAVRSGLAWGAILFLFLGWCGEGMDKLTDGSPHAQNVYLGQAVGFAVGLAVFLFGHEWTKVDVSDFASL